MLTPNEVKRAIDRLSQIPFFPTREGVDEVLAEEFEEFIETDEQLLWLTSRVMKLYDRWPGVREMRAVYCSRYKPKDGFEADSTIYPDGIPSEHPEPALPALPPAPIAEVLPEAAETLKMADFSMNRRTPLPRAPEPPPWPAGVRRITAEDIARAEDEIRERKAREELQPPMPTIFREDH